jgi:outer membrane protein
MKKTFFLVVISLMMIASTFAQKFAYVDTEYILNNIPTYKAAQDQLDKLSADWQKEIENKYAEIDKMYKDYQTESVMLSADMKKKRENEIVEKEKQTKELQKKYFGKDGALFKKRQELVKPIQDEVFNKVKEMAVEGNYSVIFDTSSGMNMLYTDPKYDKSDEVLTKLGYKN